VLFPILAVAIILLYSYKENKAKKRAMEEGTAAQKSPVSPRELIAKGVESVIIVLLIAALSFYVVYTMWYGFGLLYLFEGMGIKLDH
jgi:hypothetical protein